MPDTTKLGTLRAFAVSSSFPILQPTNTIPLAPAVDQVKAIFWHSTPISHKIRMTRRQIYRHQTYVFKAAASSANNDNLSNRSQTWVTRIDGVIYVAVYALGELEGSGKHIWANKGVRHLGRYLVKVMRQVRKLMWLSRSNVDLGAAFFETTFKDFHPTSFNEGFPMSGRAFSML